MKKTRVQLAGGIGNQLFQLAAGIHFSKLRMTDLVLVRPEVCDSRYFHDDGLWKIPKLKVMRRSILLRSGIGGLLWRIDRKLISKLQIVQKVRGIYEFKDNEDFKSTPKNLKEVRGYFQILDFAIEARKDIQNSLQNVYSSKLEEIHNSIKTNETISLHIRRGDYGTLDHIYGTLGKAYYLTALENCRKISGSQRVLVFSDDLSEAEKMLSEIAFQTFDFQFISSEFSPAESILLMSFCSAHIVANSTFSWWGAFLSDSTKIVVYPSPWTKTHLVENDFFPAEWKPNLPNWD
jgi:hypothetical protein